MSYMKRLLEEYEDTICLCCDKYLCETCYDPFDDALKLAQHLRDDHKND